MAEQIQVSYEIKPALLSIESWLLNRDPCNGLWNNRHVAYPPLYTLNN